MTPRELDSLESLGCNESKCVSKGNSDLFDGSFTCYGEEGTGFDMMCSDGFLPVLVESEPPFAVNGDISLKYFTCCPPNHLPPQATRHCSDPITFEAGDAVDVDNICDNQDIRNITLQMKSSVENPINAFGTIEGEIIKDSYLCCDFMPTVDYNGSIFKNDTEGTLQFDFLNDAECVPYHNKLYESSNVHNKLGCIENVVCELEDFPFARPIGGADNGIVSTTAYQCCKSGPALPPYVQDSTFRITTYIPLILYSIVVITSGIVVLGLLIPLFTQLKNGTFQEAQRKGIRRPVSASSSTSTRGSTLPRSSSYRSSSLGRSSRHSSIGTRGKRPCFSTYNLYLVYLALPDLLYALYEVWMYGSLINQNFNPAYYAYVVLPSHSSSPNFSPDWALFVTYKYLNMAINAVVANEVMDLLRNSKNGIKVRPPSLKKVNRQMGIVFFAAVVYFLGFYFLQDAVRRAENNGDIKKKMILFIVLSVYKLLTGFSLAGYVIYLTIVVWWRNYLPSLTQMTAKQKSMRELYFYFFRIVILFIAIWLPCVILLLYANVTGEPWPILACSCAGAIQAILTAGAILTKSDVRNYILDLVTLSYLFGKRPRDSSNALPMRNSKNVANASGYTEHHSFASKPKAPTASIDGRFHDTESQEFTHDSEDQELGANNHTGTERANEVSEDQALGSNDATGSERDDQSSEDQ